MLLFSAMKFESLGDWRDQPSLNTHPKTLSVLQTGLGLKNKRRLLLWSSWIPPWTAEKMAPYLSLWGETDATQQQLRHFTAPCEMECKDLCHWIVRHRL